MRQTVLVVLSTVFAVCGCAEVSGQKRFVELELATSARAPVETQQRWMKMLSEVGADRVRSRTANSSAKIAISETETSLAIRIKVQGAIQDGKLVLPGRSFSIRDKEELRDYIQKLRDDGANVALAEKKAFGLTSVQLVSVNKALTAKLELQTRGRLARDVVDFAEQQLTFDMEVSLAAKRAFARREPLQDELDGLSIGTALAAAIRPLGLVLLPHREQGSETKLKIVEFHSVDEHWPVGWPAPRLPKKMAPTLFTKYPIEIREFPLDQALSAVQAKAKIPLLFDYNSMARAEIDLSGTRVSFVKDRSSYIHALGKILNQTKPRMDYEIRVDENGKPFLWITTANPVR